MTDTYIEQVEDDILNTIDEFQIEAPILRNAFYAALGINQERIQGREETMFTKKLKEAFENGYPLNRISDLLLTLEENGEELLKRKLLPLNFPEEILNQIIEAIINKHTGQLDLMFCTEVYPDIFQTIKESIPLDINLYSTNDMDDFDFLDVVGDEIKKCYQDNDTFPINIVFQNDFLSPHENKKEEISGIKIFLQDSKTLFKPFLENMGVPSPVLEDLIQAIEEKKQGVLEITERNTQGIVMIPINEELFSKEKSETYGLLMNEIVPYYDSETLPEKIEFFDMEEKYESFSP